MRVLVAGPWIGEFGWELMKWIPYLRKYSQGYDKLVVVIRQPMLYYYRNINNLSPLECYYHDIEGQTNIYVCDKKAPKLAPKISDYYNALEGEVTFLEPSPAEVFAERSRYEYSSYSRLPPGYPRMGRFLAHARMTNKVSSGRKNWSKEKWDLLYKKLKQRDISLNFIGSVEGSYCPSGAEDKRGVASDYLVSLLSFSRLCIGPSSGPIHLASLCGCPHLVWGGAKLWNSGSEKSTLRERYTKLWNPLSTPCTVLDEDDWNPEVDKVFNIVLGQVNQ